MSLEQTEATLRAFLDAVYRGHAYEAYLADDIAISLNDGPELTGRHAAAQIIARLLDVTFETSGGITSMVVGAGRAAMAAEPTFRDRVERRVAASGTSVISFVRPVPTVRLVTTPYVIFCDLAGEQITALRIYGLPTDAVQQLLSRPGAAASQTDDTRYRPDQRH